MKAADMFSLKGRVALVTGASSGLGRHFARTLADNGAAVALVARRAERLAELQASIEAAGGCAITVEADVTNRTAMARAFDAAEQAFGTVTILVNNAGIAQSGRAIDMAPEEWRKVLTTNLDAVFFSAQEPARRMLTAKKPDTIINITSVLDLRSPRASQLTPPPRPAWCNTPRHWRWNLPSRACASTRLRRDGFVTEMNAEYLPSEAGAAIKREIPAGRFGKDGDLDGALLLLASDAGSYIASTTIVVDGGQVVAIKG